MYCTDSDKSLELLKDVKERRLAEFEKAKKDEVVLFKSVAFSSKSRNKERQYLSNKLNLKRAEHYLLDQWIVGRRSLSNI